MKTHLLDLTCNADITLILNIPYFKFSYLQTSRADAKWPLHCYTTFPRIPKCRSEGPLLSTSWRCGRWYPCLARVSCRGEGIQRRQLDQHLGHRQTGGLLQQKHTKVSLWQSFNFAHAHFKATAYCPPPHSSFRNFFNMQSMVKWGS